MASLHIQTPSQPPSQPPSQSPSPPPSTIPTATNNPTHTTGLNYGSVLWIPLMHVGALAAIPFFSTRNLAVAALLYFVTGCLGITLTYHRMLAHRTFAVPKWLERILATFAALAMEGGPIKWIGHHRMHHAHADTDLDPHDSRRGFFYCHVGWTFLYKPAFDDPERQRKFARDIYNDPYYRWLDTTPGMLIPQAILAGILFLVAGGGMAGLGLILWGVCLRMTLVYHATWLVNSATHFFGYKNYAVDDMSRNTWWVALFGFGEGWHNNHHAHPGCVEAGHKWWEFDITMGVVRLLNSLGLVTKMKSIRDHAASKDLGDEAVGEAEAVAGAV